MKLTKEQVEMFKDDAENATYKHGYNMTIIDLYSDWLEMDMREKQRCLGMITSEEAIELSNGLMKLGKDSLEE